MAVAVARLVSIVVTVSVTVIVLVLVVVVEGVAAVVVEPVTPRQEQALEKPAEPEHAETYVGMLEGTMVIWRGARVGVTPSRRFFTTSVTVIGTVIVSVKVSTAVAISVTRVVSVMLAISVVMAVAVAVAVIVVKAVAVMVLKVACQEKLNVLRPVEWYAYVVAGVTVVRK